MKKIDIKLTAIIVCAVIAVIVFCIFGVQGYQ